MNRTAPAHTDTLREIRALGFLDTYQRALKASDLATDAARLTRYASALRLSQRLSTGQLVTRIMRASRRLAENAAADVNPHARPVCALAL